MALTLFGFTLTASLKGEAKGTRTKTWEIAADPAAIDDDAAMATARAAASTIISTYKVITKANVLSYSLRAIYVEDAAQAIPADADVYTEALMSVGLDAVGYKKGSHTIFAPAEGVFVGDDEASGQIDTTDPNLLTYLANFAAPNWGRVDDGEQILSNPKVLEVELRSVSSGKKF